MSAIDIIISIFLIYGVIRGFKNGLVKELASLIALVAGIFFASKHNLDLLFYLKEIISLEDTYLTLISFSIIFIFVVVSIYTLSKIITKLLNIIALGLFNKILGGVFGGLKKILICSLMLLLFEQINKKLEVFDATTTKKSILYKPIHSLNSIVSQYAFE